MNTVLLSRLAAAALLAVSVAGTAAAQQRGGGYISDFVGCQEHGWQGVEAVFIRIQERNAQESNFNIFIPPTFAASFVVPSDFPWGQWFEANAYAGVGGGSWFYQPNPPIRIRVTPGSGATIYGSDVGNPFHGTVEVQNWSGLAGCNARGEVWIRDRFD